MSPFNLQVCCECKNSVKIHDYYFFPMLIGKYLVKSTSYWCDHKDNRNNIDGSRKLCSILRTESTGCPFYEERRKNEKR